MIAFDGFKDTIYGFPSHDEDPAKKVKKEWCMKFAKAIYSLYLRDNTGICYGDVDRYYELRAYGNGEQSTERYKDLLLGRTEGNKPIPAGPQSGNKHARKGYMNIDWDILAIAPNFKSVVLGTFEEVEHDVKADGIDEMSSQIRENAKWNLWFEREFADLVQEFRGMVGPTGEPPSYIPKTIEELNMFSEMGGFRLKSEVSIEEGIKYTLSLSEWKEIKRKLFEDLFDLGVAGIRDYVDPQTQKVQARYCDVPRCVIPYSRATDYKNMPFAGEFVDYTISEIRALNQFDEAELLAIANAWQGKIGNPRELPENWRYNDDGRWYYDDWKVLVLDCEYKSSDNKYTTKRINKRGQELAYDSKYGKVYDREDRKTIVTATEMVYKCKWVVGTNCCWDYGHQFDIPRPVPSKANLSFHFYKVQGRSKTDMMRPVLDQMQLNWLKIQNALAKAPPKGLAIEYSTLNNISLGGNTLKPLEVLQIRQQTGDLLYSATTHRGYSPSAASYKPIQEMEGGLGNQLNEFIVLFDKNLETLRGITGINRIADASSPKGEDGLGVSQIAQAATVTALKPLYSAYTTIKERCCQNIALRIQLLVKFNKTYELGYYQVFGKAMTQALKIGSEVNNAMFGIRIEVRPSAAEKAKIEAAAVESMKAGKNGYIGISMSDYLLINNFIEKGMLKFAQAYLSAKENELTAQQEKQKAAAIKQQGDQLAQIEQEKAKAQQEKIEAETKKELQIIAEQGREDRKSAEFTHNLKMREMDRQSQIDEKKELTAGYMEKVNNQ
jgi:hypothetical protein